MRSPSGTSRLALLLLLQLATPAQTLAIQGDGQSTVVGFIEVMNKSSCQPMQQLVDVNQEFPEAVEYIFIPTCVPLRRCSGCCSDELMECHPTDQRNITLQVMQIHMRSSQKVELTFVEHHACECRLKQKLLKAKRSRNKTLKKRPGLRKDKKKASCYKKCQPRRKKANLD
ncbi:snake venom vascular endothelial growth factor toxin HF [Kryptolebias marmoratus]|uniref:Snake venom vascular endothelial growth factor toxin HF-like n=1 Tax=Kryptolebias marmoratus TaxID=37003 RepID=A0A3Q2ZCM0_KRYMA|nr:snake venom vascular endothelial growth factor toxin HF [Kryptolebias marmoratus]